VHFHVDAQAADGSSNSTVGLGVQLLDASRNPVIGEQFGGTSVDFTQTLTTGFYVVEVRGGNSSPIENFQMGIMTGQFAAGAVAGGFADANTVGFGAFYLTAAQQVTIQVFGQPSVVRQADCRLSRAARARLTFSRISAALAVQMNGLGWSLCLSMYAWIATISSSTSRKIPRRNPF